MNLEIRCYPAFISTVNRRLQPKNSETGRATFMPNSSHKPLLTYKLYNLDIDIQGCISRYNALLTFRKQTADYRAQFLCCGSISFTLHSNHVDPVIDTYTGLSTSPNWRKILSLHGMCIPIPNCSVWI